MTISFFFFFSKSALWQEFSLLGLAIHFIFSFQHAFSQAASSLFSQRPFASAFKLKCTEGAEVQPALDNGKREMKVIESQNSLG